MAARRDAREAEFLRDQAAVQMRMDADGTVREDGAIRMQGKQCELIAGYLKALEGISYRDWGIVVDIMEHGFERRQKAILKELRFDLDDEVQKEIMREAAK